MDNNILITSIVCVVLLGIVGFFIIKSFSQKRTQKAKDEQLAQNIKEKLSKSNEKMSSAHDLINKNSGAAKGGGGILSQKIVVEKIKAANWTESESYEEDIKNVDIDNLLKTEEVAPLVKKEPQELIFNTKKIEEKQPIIEVKPQILLVDDSMVVRKYVGDLLKKHGYEVIMKTDGWEAITYLNASSQKPELIISDIEMPNMNGFQLIEAIRKEKKFNNVPLLVISAHAESHLKLMENENIQGFIKKPFEDNDLLSQITYLLSSN